MRKALIILAVLLVPALAGAATYYVAPNGSDADVGTEVAPWQSLEYAIEDGSSDGDFIVLFQNGSGVTLVEVWKAGTNNEITLSRTGGTTYVTAHEDDYKDICIDVPTTATANLFENGSWFSLSGVSIINSNSVAVRLFRSMGQDFGAGSQPVRFVLEDVYMNLSASQLLVFNPDTDVDTTHEIVLRRCKLEGIDGRLVYPSGTTGGWVDVQVESCIINSPDFVLISTNSDMYKRIYLANNTITDFKYFSEWFMAGTSEVVCVNNLVHAEDAAANSGASNFLVFDEPCTEIDFPSNWTVQNNVWFPAATTYTDQTAISSAPWIENNYGSPTQVWGHKNFAADPSLNFSTFEIGSTSNARGLGDDSYLPSTDFNGTAWSGPHVGAIANYGVTSGYDPRPTINNGHVVYTGDSIGRGIGLRSQSSGHGYYTEGGEYTGGPDWSDDEAIGGRGVMSAYWLVDRIALDDAPQYLVFLLGHNNIDGLGNTSTPANLNKTRYAQHLRQAMRKAAWWGMTPILMEMCPASNGDYISVHQDWNQATREEIQPYGYDCDSCIERFGFNPSFPAEAQYGGYYLNGSGLAGNVHPTDPGYDALISVVADLINNRSDYHIDDVNGGVTAAATYNDPITTTGTYHYSSQQVGFSGATLYTSGATAENRRVEGHGTLTGNLDPQVNGGASSYFVVKDGYWQGGIQIDKEGWQLDRLSADGGVTIQQSGNSVYNITAYEADVTVDANIRFVNNILRNLVVDGGTVTGGNNVLSGATSGAGAYVAISGTSDWYNTDPDFQRSGSSNFSIERDFETNLDRDGDGISDAPLTLMDGDSFKGYPGAFGLWGKGGGIRSRSRGGLRR